MNYGYWPGAYNFNQQIGMFLEFWKEQIDSLLYKMSQVSMMMG